MIGLLFASGASSSSSSPSSGHGNHATKWHLVTRLLGLPQERWLDRFVEFLKPLVRQEDFTLYSDQDIKIGQEWHQDIQAHLDGAKAVVLLISQAFLASDYISNSELPVILKNAADQGVRIFPILISPSLYTRANTNIRIQRLDRKNLPLHRFKLLIRPRRRWSN
jgi:hypothetical protein